MSAPVDRSCKILWRQSADCVDRHTGSLNTLRKAIPFERPHARMRRRRLHGTQDRKIDVELRCARQLFARMAGRADDQIARS